MGSFNTSCKLTHEIIDGQTEVVALMLTKRPYDTRMPVHSWDIYAPVPILFEGVYNSYGCLEKLKLFQSKEVLSEDARKAAEEALFNDLKDIMQVEGSSTDNQNHATNLEQLVMDRDISFVKKSQNTAVMIMETIVQMADMELKDKPEAKEELNERYKVYLDKFGFKNIEEMRDGIEIQKKEEKINIISVSWMMFRKDAFMKLLNEYGMEETVNEEDSEEDEDSFDDERYAVKIQRERKYVLGSQTEEMNEMIDFLNKHGSYSGANRPEYTFDHAIKGSAKKLGQVREDLITLKKMHSLDISLLNDYFTLLGMTYQPSMYVSEEARNYGFTEAFAMQQTLLESVKPKSKNTP